MESSNFQTLNCQTLPFFHSSILFPAQSCPFCAVRIFSVLLSKFSLMAFDIVFVGYVAGFCTAVAQFPQAYKVIKTGETHSISLGMYVTMTFGIFFWFLYGLLIPDFPMIIANFVCLIPSLYILYITIRNLNKIQK